VLHIRRERERESVCVCVCVCVPLVIEHAKRMCRIIFSSVARPTVPCFTTLSHKRHDFGKIYVCFDFLYFYLKYFLF
jgi:hypothetical protein